ncbi:MAG: PEP-CTERM sorting domain-containing protein, partial [Thermoguttaceae bacterium]
DNTALPDGTSLAVGAGATLIFSPLQAGSLVAVSPGAVAVPESGTLVLLAASAIVAFAAWRRRRN